MYNRELQVIDTQEKAYLLGLFYSDGNIGLNQTQCRIELSINDKDLIFHLKQLFPFFYIHYDKGTKIELGNYNKKLKEDLINNGCLPRKSFENRDNLHIPYIENTLIKHFIRGYFDGDGGCTVSHFKDTQKKTQKRVYIYSASKFLLEEIRDFLSDNNIESTINYCNHKNKLISMYKLSIAALSYKKFYNFLYNESTIYLNRKREKFLDILENTNFFCKKPSITCKFCNSTNTVCDGRTYYKIRRQIYLCKDCKRHFTAPLSSNTQSGGDELLEA